MKKFIAVSVLLLLLAAPTFAQETPQQQQGVTLEQLTAAVQGYTDSVVSLGAQGTSLRSAVNDLIQQYIQTVRVAQGSLQAIRAIVDASDAGDQEALTSAIEQARQILPPPPEEQ